MTEKQLFDGEKILDFIIPIILIESFVIIQIGMILLVLNMLGVI